MPKHFIYPIYTSALALLTFALVPRKEIRRLAMYGIFFGAAADVMFILFMGLINIGEYIHYGYFGAFGIPFFPPISWTAYFIMYLYVLPKNRPWNYLFPAIASGYSVYFSNILQALGILKWNYGNPILPLLIIYAPWHFGVAWAYFRMTGEAVKKKEVQRFTIVPKPVMKKDKNSKRISFVKPKKL